MKYHFYVWIIYLYPLIAIYKNGGEIYVYEREDLMQKSRSTK